MNKEILTAELIKAADYGLEEKKGEELTKDLVVVKAERDVLIEEFKVISKLELLEENIPKFKELRLRIGKNRTQGINKWHKANKDYFLTGGRFVDAIKNKENLVNEQMESKLLAGEKHFENLEIKRLANLQLSRVNELTAFVEDAKDRDLSSMDLETWDAYLTARRNTYLTKVKAELELENERLTKIEAEKVEQERIRKENETLRIEAEQAEAKRIADEEIRLQAEKQAQEERERLAKIEQDKRNKIEAERNEKARKDNLARVEKENVERKIRDEKLAKERAENEAKLKAERDAKAEIEAELLAKKQAEAKRIADEEMRLQAELSKGDAAKFKDLNTDLELLKTKYSFKSAKNQKMYADTKLLIDKVIAHINK